MVDNIKPIDSWTAITHANYNNDETNLTIQYKITVIIVRMILYYKKKLYFKHYIHNA